ncbi:hypothetical protein [Ralstonia solanacearum]|uniref:hypothetical protein n=1 Tax=Ralstonia solanacearum TaxID=305 RepID=UPI00107188F2|nr:hypothetical protein [Ralstonia solanacearum]
MDKVIPFIRLDSRGIEFEWKGTRMVLISGDANGPQASESRHAVQHAYADRPMFEPEKDASINMQFDYSTYPIITSS